MDSSFETMELFPPEKSGMDLRSAYNNPERFTDAIVTLPSLNDTSIHVHKLILSAYSSFFDKCFSTNLRESNTSKVSCHDPVPQSEMLQTIIKSMYTGYLEVSNEATKLALALQVTDKYGISKIETILIEKIYHLLKNSINNNNNYNNNNSNEDNIRLAVTIVIYLRPIQKKNHRNLMTIALQIIAKNRREALESVDIESLNFNQLKYVLSSFGSSHEHQLCSQLSKDWLEFNQEQNTNSNHAIELFDVLAHLDSPGVCGMKNLGNSAWLNTPIQCLSKAPLLKEYFCSNEYQNDINRNTDESRYGASIAEYTAELVQEIWNGNHACIEPIGFRTFLAETESMYSWNEKRDCSEFTAYLLDFLSDGLNRVKRKPLTDFVEKKGDERPDREVAREAWKQHKRRNDSIISDLFDGQLKAVVDSHNQGCPKSTTFDPFFYLSLHLPSDRSRDTTLKECLDLFEDKEEKDIYCNACKQFVITHLQERIYKPPKILIILFKRFNRYNRENIYTHVDYPIRDLDLSEYVLNDESAKPIYNLFAVAEHTGGFHNGHWEAFARYPTWESWYKFDDSLVFPVPDESVVTSGAYLLFYARQDVEQECLDQECQESN